MPPRVFVQMEAFDIHSPIHRISVDQFHRMIDAGVFADGDRVELIDGEMRDMSPIGPPHGGSTNSLTMIFAPPLAGVAIVSVRGPLVLDDGTEVYPDLMVLKQRDDRYARSNPTAEDVLLLVEVADTSLALDTGVKLAKYARAGIRRYWVADIPHRTLHDYRDPDRFGQRYRQLHSLREGLLDILIEGIEIRVETAELFPG
ncbi:Uma2 family endonuclease [Thiorhodococcus mannitoliphagus]|uniref:Uma2 family endonuclease n=1 Tax=Thiorhodococcus mannitoliphagus TaxID=329406 RepID=A0A6P1DQF7_9GAMM|nr:Uma2 family endonuclease [Thiorhodococcus mannitoliphagus]NEX20258.1 Uma2 family endonuclease [Thiorhodococcus mannitoliphagus]